MWLTLLAISCSGMAYGFRLRLGFLVIASCAAGIVTAQEITRYVV